MNKTEAHMGVISRKPLMKCPWSHEDTVNEQLPEWKILTNFVQEHEKFQEKTTQGYEYIPYNLTRKVFLLYFCKNCGKIGRNSRGKQRKTSPNMTMEVNFPASTTFV